MERLGGHGRAKYTTGIRLGTSRDRGWDGLLAERWRHSEGDLGEVQVRDTEVIVMLQGRLHIRRRGDGRLQQCDAVPGTVWLCPKGVREDMIRLYGEVEESLHLYLPSSPLSATALQELDVDPDRVGLHYDGGFHDFLIEQIARTVQGEMTDPSPAGRMLVETLAAALGVHVMRRYSNLEHASTPLPSPRGALDARRLQRVTNFIDTPSQRGSDDRDIGRGGLSQPLPLRPRLQGRDRNGAAPLSDRSPNRPRQDLDCEGSPPPRRDCRHVRVLVPGPPDAVVQAHRRHDASRIPHKPQLTRISLHGRGPRSTDAPPRLAPGRRSR